MIKISVVIITFNEERNIDRCIKSVLDIADEIVVLDSLSTDKTKEICLKYPVRFIEQPFLGHIEQKNNALEFASYPHVLSLDADEALSEELKKSILEVKHNWNADGYYFNRLTNFCGTWVRHSGWYPDKKLRLWVKEKGQWGGLNPHDMVMMAPASKVKFLKGDLTHYSYYSMEDFFNRTKKYAIISARSLRLQGTKFTYFNLIFSPTWRFFKNYFVELGFLDGKVGYIISRTMAHGVYLKYKELSQIYKAEKLKS